MKTGDEVKDASAQQALQGSAALNSNSSYKLTSTPNATFFTNPLAGRPAASATRNAKVRDEAGSSARLAVPQDSGAQGTPDLRVSQDPTAAQASSAENLRATEASDRPLSTAGANGKDLPLSNIMMPLPSVGPFARRRSVSFSPTPLTQAFAISSDGRAPSEMLKGGPTENTHPESRETPECENSSACADSGAKSPSKRLSQLSRSKSTPGIAGIPKFSPPKPMPHPQAFNPSSACTVDNFASPATSPSVRNSILNLTGSSGVTGMMGSSHMISMTGSMHFPAASSSGGGANYRPHFPRQNLISIVPQKSLTVLNVVGATGSDSYSSSTAKLSDAQQEDAAVSATPASPPQSSVSPSYRKSIKVPVFPPNTVAVRESNPPESAVQTPKLTSLVTATSEHRVQDSPSFTLVPTSPTVAPGVGLDDTARTLLPPPRLDLDDTTIVPKHQPPPISYANDSTVSSVLPPKQAPSASERESETVGSISVAERKRIFGESNIVLAIKAAHNRSTLERASTLDNSQCSPGASDRSQARTGFVKSVIYTPQVHEQYTPQSPMPLTDGMGAESESGDQNGQVKEKPLLRKLGVQVLPPTRPGKEGALRPVSMSFSGGQAPALQPLQNSVNSSNNLLLEKAKLRPVQKPSSLSSSMQKVGGASDDELSKHYAKLAVASNDKVSGNNAADSSYKPQQEINLTAPVHPQTLEVVGSPIEVDSPVTPEAQRVSGGDCNTKSAVTVEKVVGNLGSSGNAERQLATLFTPPVSDPNVAELSAQIQKTSASKATGAKSSPSESSMNEQVRAKSQVVAASKADKAPAQKKSIFSFLRSKLKFSS